jgi:hypothetical protein
MNAACTLVVPILGLIAAVASTAAGAAASGVEGRVTLSPSCPGAQRAGSDCRAPYADARLLLISDRGAAVASARAAPDGAYRLYAPAGRYRLRVTGTAKPTHCPSIEVTVAAEGYTVSDIDCDSGMR